jgi:hypothetical protein
MLIEGRVTAADCRMRCPALVLLLALALTSVPATAAAADLQARTVQAWDAYVASARRAFVTRTRDVAAAARTPDQVTASAAREDGIIDVPGGLVHHWIGRAYLRGVTLARALTVAQDYPSYSRMYESVVSSRVLDHQGDTFRVLLRLREGGGGITAVLDVRSTITYSRPDASTVLSVSVAQEIREVENPGGPDERLLPQGRDSGYLWRADTFTYFREHAGGLYVEMETVGLSREFPPLLGWIIEPIARRIGRKSVEGSIQEFIAAIRKR